MLWERPPYNDNRQRKPHADKKKHTKGCARVLDLTIYLEDLEKRVDPQDEDRLEKTWITFADGKCTDNVFTPRRNKSLPTVDYPPVLINHAFEDEDLMIYQQLYLVNEELSSGKGNLLNIRANYGTGIIPSMFGAKLFMMDDALDTLPCTRPLADGQDGVVRLLEQRRADFSAGLAGKVFRFAEKLADALKPYPKLRRYLHVYHPDLQGPFPLADSLWGGDIYIAMFDDVELLNEMLTYMTDVYIDFSRRWEAVFPNFDAEHSVEWGLLHRGGVIIRNDACVNISGDMYEEFVMPYDQRILRELGGGVHFCGRGDHYINHVCDMENISCLNLSQPHLNNMETIYQASIDRGIPIIGMVESEVTRALAAGRDLRGLVHCGASLAAWIEKAPDA